ncbi:hypothetical protein D915_002382 [Fasciola hepatica]|uniref:Uncharacterized protein n=1 Tax=Fasciola hepatica TaxID=6192 RepID=A0A2H1CPW6_FASHE|nr:hypothetical protein D915_002382 [Fasciola hepatica]
MDIQPLLKSLHVDKIEQWHVLFAASTTIALMVFTYVCYHFMSHKRLSRSKKSKTHKKRNDEKRTTTEPSVDVANSLKDPAAPSASFSKQTKATRKKQALVVHESIIEPVVSTVKAAPIEAAVNIPQSEPKTDSSDIDDGQWIEVRKGKRDTKNIPNHHADRSETVPNQNKGLTPENQAPSVKKRETNDRKGKQSSGLGSAKTGRILHPGYKPIEEPDFTKPPKPNRRGLKDEEEEEWQEVRFSRRGRKFTNKE